MTKTIWMIKDETDNTTTELTYYHFKSNPQFPSWYMNENPLYTVEMIFNLKLVRTPKIFFKCLTHFYVIK